MPVKVDVHVLYMSTSELYGGVGGDGKMMTVTIFSLCRRHFLSFLFFIRVGIFLRGDLGISLFITGASMCS